MRLNLAAHCLARNARERGEQTALMFLSANRVEYSATYNEITRECLRMAAALRSMVSPGERIALRLRHGPEYALAFFAANAAGCVPVPLSPQLQAEELAFIIQDAHCALSLYDATLPCPDWNQISHSTSRSNFPSASGSKKQAIELKSFFITVREQPDSSLYFADTTAEDPAFLVYTSGTGGYQKGVLHAQRSILGREPMQPGWHGMNSADRVLHAGALNWTYTLGVGLMDPWCAGATACLHTGNIQPTDWPRLWQEYNITMFAAVPSLYRRILKYDDLRTYDLKALRHALTAGEALLPDLLHAWRQATDKPMYEALGMSEVSTYISSGPQTPVRAGSPGRPQPGRRVAILLADQTRHYESENKRYELAPTDAIGLLAIHRSDPGLMLGYWNRPEEERAVYADEWFIGGDLACIDADGYVYYHGRDNELMNASGYRVSPLEVERCLQNHADVAEVAVTEVRLPSQVSLIVAYIVPVNAELPHAAEKNAMRWPYISCDTPPNTWRNTNARVKWSLWITCRVLPAGKSSADY